MQSALGEGNREGDDSYANLEDRDIETSRQGNRRPWCLPIKCSKPLLISCSVPGNGFPNTTSGLPLRRPRRNNTGSG